MKKLISYLLIGMVTLFMSGCNGNGTGNDTPYVLGDEIIVNKAIIDPTVNPDQSETENVVTSSVTVIDGPVSIGKVTVGLNLTHDGYLSDVNVWLESPSGTIVFLSNGSGVSEAGSFDITLDDEAIAFLTDQVTIDLVGTFSPDGLLADFNGEDANGVWTLHAVDTYVTDGEGVLVSWSLNIEANL